MIDLKELQDRVWANKEAKGFNLSNVEKEFNLAYGELAETYDAYRKGKDSVGEELADVAIYLLALAKMLHVDLEAEMLAKLGINERRSYTEQTVNGARVRLKDPAAEQHGHPSQSPHPDEHHHHG